MQKRSSQSHKKVQPNKGNVQNTAEQSYKKKKQNIKEFKLEIDHQIAKCLDTLDRQGLKYLKQTLRGSVIFGISEDNGQQNYQDHEDIHHNSNKKIQEGKTKLLIQKKQSLHKGKTIDNNRNVEKTHIRKTQNIKISKKVQQNKPQKSQNITKGKQNINNNKPKMHQKEEKIEEEIVEQLGVFSDDSETDKQKTNQVTKLYDKTSHPITQQIPHTVRVSPSKYQPSIQLAQPIRPFNKSARRQATNKPQYNIETNNIQIKPKHQKQQIINQLQQQQIVEQVANKKQIDVMVQKINNLPADKLKQLGKIIQRLQRVHDEGLNPSSVRPYIVTPNISQVKSKTSQMRVSTAGNKSRRPEQKATSLFQPIMNRNKRENINLKQQQEIEQNKNRQLEDFIVKGSESDQIEEDVIVEEQPLKPSRQLSMRSNQRQGYLQQRNISQPITEVSQQISQIQKSNIKQQQSPNKISKNTFNKASSTFMKKLSTPSSFFRKPLDIDITQSHQVQTIDLDQLTQMKSSKINKNLQQQNIQLQQQNETTQQQMMNTNKSVSKMMKIGKKKLGTNKIQITLVKNRGHSNIIGLTGIQFYNTNCKVITISAQNIIAPQSSKVMNLFNSRNLTINQQHMYTAIMETQNIIQLQIPEKIGGVKIWNYNKSQIQSNKETDQLQININQKLMWSGAIKRGSYNQLNQYATEIVLDNSFLFPCDQNDSEFKSQNMEKNQMSVKSEDIGEQKRNIGKIDRNNNKKDDDQTNKKVLDWLQQSVMEEKMKELKAHETNQNDNEQHQIQKNAEYPIFKKTKPEEQSLGISDIGFGVQRKINQPKGRAISTNRNHEIKQPQQFKQTFKTSSRLQENRIKPKISRNNNVNSNNNLNNGDKLGGQIDIISSFKNSMMKEKQTAIKIDNKVSEIKYETDKFKQKYINNNIQKLEEPVKYIEPSRESLQRMKPKTHQKSLQDFMNDSIFQEPTKPVKSQRDKRSNTNNATDKSDKNSPATINYQSVEHKKQQKYEPKKKDDLDLSQFINQLDSLVGDGNKQNNKYKYGDEKKKQITIPELPKGMNFELNMETNWGDSQFLGISRIQVFDSNGVIVYPTKIVNASQLQKYLAPNSVSPTTLFKSNSVVNSSESIPQLIFKKQKNPIPIILQFSRSFQISLIRIGNYIGDRVHTSIGVRSLKILFDSAIIFMGEIRKGSGTSPTDPHHYENIMFTNNKNIIVKIRNNDWLGKLQQNQIIGRKNQRNLFKKTLESFHRPITKGQGVNKNFNISEKNHVVKIPKRQCFQFDPPTLPGGYFLKIILYSTWGDRDFIGLNGINIFDQTGNQIEISSEKVKELSTPLSSLSGYEKDQRMAKNLFNNVNFSEKQEDTWLAPLISDIQKMQRKQPNSFLIQLPQSPKISGINFYNYLKNPQRGVRQIQLFMDHSLIYRGYLRMSNVNLEDQQKHPEMETHTTIAFTKDAELLNKMVFMGYHEDNLEQYVSLINEGKVLK